MKPINTSIFDFPTLIRNGFVYVDKTAQINYNPADNVRTTDDVACERVST